MSLITEMIIVSIHDESTAVATLNSYIGNLDKDRHQQFGQLDETAAGGSKLFTGRIWAMAGNFFPFRELINVLGTFPWEYPEDVIFICNHNTQETLAFRMSDL